VSVVLQLGQERTMEALFEDVLAHFFAASPQLQRGSLQWLLANQTALNRFLKLLGDKDHHSNELVLGLSEVVLLVAHDARLSIDVVVLQYIKGLIEIVFGLFKGLLGNFQAEP
jgi:hypothetical protein